MFLQPHNTEFGNFGVCTTTWCQNEWYHEYDYSFVIGQGLCTPVWFWALEEWALEEFCDEGRLISNKDCININKAIHENQRDISSIMKHSVQPPLSYSTVEEVITSYKLRNAIHGLVKTESSNSTDIFLKRESPRILHCEENITPSLCHTIGMVASSEGSSIGINFDKTMNPFNVNKATKTFYSQHIEADLKM